MSIREYLQGHKVWFELFLHAPTPSASKLAQAARVSGRHVAKGVLVHAGGEYVLAVLPATSLIDLDRLSQVLDGHPVALATEEEAADLFDDCERGAVPPFGKRYGLRTVADMSLAGGTEIVCIGNRRHEGIRLRYRDYEALETPLRARFATTTEPKRRRTTHRRAG